MAEHHWTIRVFQQKYCPPFLPFCAIAQRTEPGKKWIINAEGKTPEEAESNLRARLEGIDGRK
jgi:hypothetical protein